MNLELDGVVKLEGPGDTELTLRGEGQQIVLSLPSARQARRLLSRPEVRSLLKMTPGLLTHLEKTGLRLRVEVAKTTVLDSRLLDRLRRPK